MSAQDFSAAVDVSNGSANGVSALDAADFDGDGLLDVAAFSGGAHAKSKLFAWFRQHSNGTWSRHEFGNTNGFDDFVGSAQCADIDGDGDQDVVVAVDGHTTGPIIVYVFENPGAAAVEGTWNHYAIATIQGVHANDMRIADMDGDGKPDVVIRHKEPHDVKVIFQNSKLDWTVKLVGTKNGEGLAVGDLNGDGRPDISVSGDWYKSPANPRTDAFTRYTVTDYTNIATKEDIGDIDGDGLPDLLISPAESFPYYGTAGNHELAWFKNPGNPENSSAWTKQVIASGVNDLSFARLADFDGDGDLDVASARDFSGSNNHVKIYYNDTLNFSRNITVAVGKGIYSGVAKDMDGDGDIDLVGENDYAGGSKPYIYRNLTGPYVNAPPDTPPAPSALSANVTGPVQITLSWADNSDNETGFAIERKTGDGTFSQIGQADPGITHFIDATGQEGIAYVYRVRAFNGTGESDWSHEAGATVPADTTPPTMVSASGSSETTVQVVFSKPVTAATAQAAANYAVDPGVTVVTTTLQGDARTVVLTVTDLAPGEIYTVTATGIQDTSTTGNLGGGSAPFVWTDWQNQDIGGVAAAGSMSFNGTAFTVAGSGADIYGSSDEFHYVFKQLTGNGEIIARVLSQVEQHPYSKAGLMFRETLDANSRSALVALTPQKGVEFNSRATAGGATDNPRIDSPAAPYWVRMVRVGNRFTGYASPNGTTWTQVGSRTISMGATVHVGMAVTSHNDGQISTAVFDNVAVSQNAAPSAPADAAGSALSGTGISITWTDTSDNELSFLVERAGSADGPWTPLPEVAADETSTTDTGRIPGTEYFYRIAARNTDGDSDFTPVFSATTLRAVDEWLQSHGLTVADFSVDTDDDGLEAGVEYALGLRPDLADAHAAPAARRIGGGLALVFTRPRPAPPDIVYTAAVSSQMEVWHAGADHTYPEEVVDNMDSTETVTIRSKLPASNNKQFIKLVVKLL